MAGTFDMNAPDSASARKYTGEYLAKNQGSQKARTQMAVEILRQQATLDELTQAQIARLCKVSPSAVSIAMNGHRKPRPAHIGRAVAIFKKATPLQRVKFVRDVGPDAVLDALQAYLD